MNLNQRYKFPWTFTPIEEEVDIGVGIQKHHIHTEVTTVDGEPVAMVMPGFAGRIEQCVSACEKFENPEREIERLQTEAGQGRVFAEAFSILVDEMAKLIDRPAHEVQHIYYGKAIDSIMSRNPKWGCGMEQYGEKTNNGLNTKLVELLRNFWGKVPDEFNRSKEEAVEGDRPGNEETGK